MREMDTVFPQLSVRQRKELLVIPIVQRCKHDLVGSTPEIEEEREFKLENVSNHYTSDDDDDDNGIDKWIQCCSLLNGVVA